MAMKPFHISLLFFGLISAAPVLGAQQAVPPSGIQLHASAQMQRTVTAADGTRHTKTVDAVQVVPGTEVTYIITYENTGKAPANAIAINDPIPEHMVYVPGSVRGEHATISFSVDGGKTWSSKPSELTVTNPDGSKRPATPRDYTHIRWVLDGALAPGAKGSVSFRAVLQ
jgi:uncharacterized repeat protein (TIGR01451 family)